MKLMEVLSKLPAWVKAPPPPSPETEAVMPSPQCQIKKFDDELQIVWGEVYVPDIPDSQGDFMTAAEITTMAHDFVRKGRLNKVDKNHDNKDGSEQVVETFIARKDDPDFIAGSWVVGVHIPDSAEWALVKDGTYNGFSMQAMAVKKKTIIVREVPEMAVGFTENVDGHAHKFTVRFSEKGELVGGETDDEDGHRHQIKRGTLTEETNGHTHRYSYLEAFVEVAQDEN